MGATVCKPADRLVSTNARGDGSFIVSLPAGSYPMVTAKSKDGLSSNLCDNAGSGATISDVKTTNVSFALDAVPTTCTVSAPQ